MIKVNLIPDNVRLARTRTRHIKGWTMSVLAGGALLAVSLGIGRLQHAEAEGLRAQNDRLQTRLAAVRAQLRSLVGQVDRAQLRIERARALRAKRRWSALLATVSRCMPEGCWLTSLATDPARPKQAPRRRAPKLNVSARAAPAGANAPVKPDSVSNTVVIDAPRKLRVIGYATKPAEPHVFVSALKDAGVFENVSLERLLREPALSGSFFRFELVCEW